MKKEEVELIILKVSADGQDAINMKIYKNGTTCRYGAGGLPQIGISGMSFINSARYFDPLIAKVPQQVLDQPLSYEEETPNGSLEYVIAFYGASTNGDTGERANWSKATGIRVKLDQQSSFNHPIMGLLDGLTMDAAELTNEWYFDVIMTSKYNAQSSAMPKETIIGQPKTEKEINLDYENYIRQMMQSARKWNMTGFVNGKTYVKNGMEYTATVAQDNKGFNITFSPKNGEPEKKSRWKFW